MISLFLLTLPRYNHSRYIIKLFNVCLTTTLRYNHSRLQKGLDIPFIFHAGETLGDGTATDSNIYDAIIAILLGTKRIEHGYVYSVRAPAFNRH